MGALRAFAAGCALTASALSFVARAADGDGSPAPERWRPIAREAADRFGLPIEWVMRVIAAESGGRTRLGGEPITSHAGAMGLMQIMPATWAALRAEYRLGSDPHDPRDNIVAGTAYLRAMYDRFGYPGLFGAYNAGPGRYGDFVVRGRPLPRETRDYIAKITGEGPKIVRSAARARPRSDLPPAQSEPMVDPIFLSRADAASRASVLPRFAADNPSEISPEPISTRRPAARSISPRSEHAEAADTIFALRRSGADGSE